jgi:hypothetical protein
MTTPPAWLDALVETTVNSMEVHSPSTIGYRYYEADDDEPWEVILYPTPVELRGGAEDGAVLSPGFSLDLKALCEAFEEISALEWTAHPFGPRDAENPSVALEGRYQAHAVYLRILAYAPADEPPGLTLDVPPQAEGALH